MKGTAPHPAPVTISLQFQAVGRSRADLIAAASRAIEIAIPGAIVRACRRGRVGARTVFVVSRPDDWTPRDMAETPPNVDRHTEPTADDARNFAEGFNEAEMADPKGYWAVV